MIKVVTVRGLVQGIGFRPFIAELAEKLNIKGNVINKGGIVEIIAECDEDILERFIKLIYEKKPEGAIITRLEVNDYLENKTFSSFSIDKSSDYLDKKLPLIPSDLPTCKSCSNEFFNPKNRRYLHPFISCTACGPRYSIIEKIPYDRDSITMSKFEMCPECQKEYVTRGDKRRHAQTIACKSCGPKLTLKYFKADSFEVLAQDSEAMASAASLLKAGEIIAIKDIGGYHLACSPFDEKAIAALRLLKHREQKPFAVMFYDLKEVAKYCTYSNEEATALESPERPIVLIKSKNLLNEKVACKSPNIGAMLPCNPVQLYLTKEVGPLVMTSANCSGDFLNIDNNLMEEFISVSKIEMGILEHDRDIITPLDDSIEKVVLGRLQYIRRGRGITPNPLELKNGSPFMEDEKIFAAGGDLKASFAFIEDGRVYFSQHLGDLDNLSCIEEYKSSRNRMENLFGFNPKSFVCDLHPAYNSRRLLENEIKGKIIKIQHHKAHVASVVAENNLTGRVVGFAFDGTGFGDDSSVYGSEVFYWENCRIRNQEALERVASIEPLTLIGGNEGAKNCDAVAYALLKKTYAEAIEMGKLNLEELNLDTNRYKIVTSAIDNNINIIRSTSMGRLFDGVAAILDICHYNSYEGQAPVMLENIAVKAKAAYPIKIKLKPMEGRKCLDVTSLIFAIVEAKKKEVDVESIALGFIYAIADFVISLAGDYEDAKIVISGGTFNNRLLIERIINKLEENNLKVYLPVELPIGDGGLALGQAYLSLNQKLDENYSKA